MPRRATKYLAQSPFAVCTLLRTARTYADGQIERLAYDAIDNPVEHIAPGGLKTTITRDAAGRPTGMAYTHLAGRGNPGATAFRYDALGRVTEASNAKSSVTQAYDTLSNPGSESVQLATAPAALLRRTHDSFGRLSEVDPPGNLNTVKFGYDRENKVITIDRNVSTNVATIKHLGARPLVREYRNGATVLGKSTLGYENTGLRPDSIDHLDRVNAVVDTNTYGWDDAYNLESVAVTGGVLAASPKAYDYDPLNRLDPDSPDFDPAWTYDDTGNRTGTGYTQTGQDADMHRYTTVNANAMHYDAQGALIETHVGPSAIHEYQYDAHGRPVDYRSVTLATASAFDPLDLDDPEWDAPLSGTWNVNNNSTPGDPVDDFLEETTGTTGAILYRPSSYPDGAGFTFAYRSLHDPADLNGDTVAGAISTLDYPGRFHAQVLLGVESQTGPPHLYCALRIEPDRISMIAFDGTVLEELDSVTVESRENTWYTVELRFTYGGPNEYFVSVERRSDVPGDAVVKMMQSTPPAELPQIDSDAIGFTVGAEARYHFKLLEHTAGPDIAETSVAWDYDPYGRKIAESVYELVDLTAQTRYVWDGWRLVSEINGLTGQPIAEYIPGPGYVDDVVASRRDLDNNGTFAADEVFYHQTNHQHSTVSLLDHNGDVAERYSYDPFGVPTIHDATGDPIPQSAYGNNRLYTGLPWLSDLGLYDNRQRLYNPAAGRFLTQDPANDPANLGNPYTYVGNNPGAYVDPYGDVLETVWDGFSLGLGTASLGYNLTQGNYLSAGIDAVGVALDATAAAIPFVPGGASAALKAYRGVDIAFNAGQATASGIDAGVAVSQGNYTGAAIAGVGAGLQGAHASVRAGQVRATRAIDATTPAESPALARMRAGREFDKARFPEYPANQVYLEKPGGGYTVLDSYNEFLGEIVSRKFTQLADIQEKSAMAYIRELPRKYPAGSKIANTPKNREAGIAGGLLEGAYILEVPVQNAPIPPRVLEYADRHKVTIRDVTGFEY